MTWKSGRPASDWIPGQPTSISVLHSMHVKRVSLSRLFSFATSWKYRALNTFRTVECWSPKYLELPASLVRWQTEDATVCSYCSQHVTTKIITVLSLRQS